MGKTSPLGTDGYKRTSTNVLLHTQVVLKVFFLGKFNLKNLKVISRCEDSSPTFIRSKSMNFSLLTFHIKNFIWYIIWSTSTKIFTIFRCRYYQNDPCESLYIPLCVRNVVVLWVAFFGVGSENCNRKWQTVSIFSSGSRENKEMFPSTRGRQDDYRSRLLKQMRMEHTKGKKEVHQWGKSSKQSRKTSV